MRLIPPLLCALSMGTTSQAQDTSTATLGVELNTIEAAADACTLTFVVTNSTGGPIEHAMFETVLFGSDGAVQSLTLFDFGTLPQDRARVRQFAVPDLACDALSRVLFNGANTCTAPDQAICDATLTPTSRVSSVEVLG